MVSSALQVHLDRIRRRKWIVAVIILLFLMGGVLSVLTRDTIYSSKAALGTSTRTRAPEQDAILAQGYADFFNDPAYQAILRERAGVPDDVTFEAETVAASPLIYVTASSTNEADVQSSASTMAAELRTTVNEALPG